MAAVKAWKLSDPNAPTFPDDFEVVNKAVLQVTDIKSNHNKFYAIEVHRAGGTGGHSYRVFTHYGRTDDLDSNPDAGQRDCRYFTSLAHAQGAYEAIYREKTSPQKGYKELSLASSRIGSSKARGQSSGQIDEQTLEKAAKAQAEANAAAASSEADSVEPIPPPVDAAAVAPASDVAPAVEPEIATVPSTPQASGWLAKLARIFGQGTPEPNSLASTVPTVGPAGATPVPRVAPTGTGGQLDPAVADLVELIYAEATSALTSTVAAKITAQGIETPLGVLTLGQITKGEAILQELYALFQKKGTKKIEDQLADLSGEFYTVIPHRIGRTRAAVQAAIINSLEAFEQKQETLQLMKDMLQVNGDGNVLYFSQSRAQYEALRCTITPLVSGGDTYREIRDYVVASQVKSRSVKVDRIFALRREHEWGDFASQMGNQRLLFHGSRIKNWVGILSRGILLPKIVVSLGVNRTDAGWLGNGIYFGDAACTSAFYTTPGRKGTRLMSVARVALGTAKEFTKITYGLAGPPAGYDSCHGVRNRPGRPSQFADDEYVVYETNQQRLEYLVEFRL